MNTLIATWQLAREQFRTNRTFATWTAVLLTLMLTALTHALVMTVTAINAERQYDPMSLEVRERYAFVSTGSEDAHQTSMASIADVRQAIDAPGDHSAYAVSFGSPYLIAGDLGGRSLRLDELWSTPSVMFYALYGDAAPLPEVVAGNYPAAPGEVALSAQLAHDLGIGIGELVSAVMVTDSSGSLETFGVPLTVTGLTTTPVLTLEGFAPEQAGYVTFEAMVDQGAMGPGVPSLNGGNTYVQLAWNGGHPQLDPYLAYEREVYVDGLVDRASGTQGRWLILVIVLFVSTLVVAFAVGRSQAATRTKWVATARTLGAERRQLTGAAFVETGLVASASLVVGLTLGTATAQFRLWLSLRDVVSPAVSEVVGWDWKLVIVVAIVALTASVAIAAVPAFWANRVPPVAALKPITPVNQAEISRRVNRRVLLVPGVLAAAGIGWAGLSPSMLSEFVAALSILICIPLLYIGVLEALRVLLPAIGRSLVGSDSPANVVAGNFLISHTRQAVAPGIIMTLAATAVTTAEFFAQLSFHEYDSWARAGAVLVVVIVLQVPIIAIYDSQRVNSLNEESTLNALGLTRQDAITASRRVLLVPQAVGLGIGIAVTAVFLVILAAAGAFGTATDQYPLTGKFLWVAAVYGLAALLFAMGTAALFARTRRSSAVIRNAQASA